MPEPDQTPAPSPDWVGGHCPKCLTNYSKPAPVNCRYCGVPLEAGAK